MCWPSQQQSHKSSMFHIVTWLVAKSFRLVWFRIAFVQWKETTAMYLKPHLQIEFNLCHVWYVGNVIKIGVAKLWSVTQLPGFWACLPSIVSPQLQQDCKSSRWSLPVHQEYGTSSHFTHRTISPVVALALTTLIWVDTTRLCPS